MANHVEGVGKQETKGINFKRRKILKGVGKHWTMYWENASGASEFQHGVYQTNKLGEGIMKSIERKAINPIGTRKEEGEKRYRRQIWQKQ